MKTTYRECVRAALRDAMLRDPRVLLMGEDVGAYGGSYACSKGLLAELGPERVRDTPLSESAFVGAGIGAAMGGLRRRQLGQRSPTHWLKNIVEPALKLLSMPDMPKLRSRFYRP